LRHGNGRNASPFAKNAKRTGTRLVLPDAPSFRPLEYAIAAVRNFLIESGMKLQIDNLDGQGLQDYTAAIDSASLPQIVRNLNKPSELKVGLVAQGPEFVVPVSGARIVFSRDNGQDLFTGYLVAAPEFEYLGWGERGPTYRYNLVAQSDEMLLDRKRLPDRSPFVVRSAGDALRQMTQDLLPGTFDLTAVQDVDSLMIYDPDPQKKWAAHAAEAALQARAFYRAMAGAVTFASVGTTTVLLDEQDSNFSPDRLKLQAVDMEINDVTAIGDIEPQAYVKDYFVGDGLTVKFYLSQTPFTKSSQTLFIDEYSGAVPDPTRWTVVDPSVAVTTNGGKLQIAGGTGTDGQTTVTFVEKVELGGALVLQHGNVAFSAASSGILGGLYNGVISQANCIAGFQITPSGTVSSIQARVNGALVGTAMATTPGHQYVFTTRIYSLEIYRRQQIFHSSQHPAGSGYGGGSVAADIRIVLEAHDIDPANPGSLVAQSTVLFDGVISGALDFCTYALVNAANMQCDIAFTRMIQAPDTEVRSALPGGSYMTRLVGALSDGAECTIVSGPALDFFTAYVPATDEQIAVHYRGQGRSIARVLNQASISAHVSGSDDGTRGVVRHVNNPPTRTATDCENAALAILDDGSVTGWAGTYETWSDFLPGGAADIFPGDGLQVNAPSRGAAFSTIVREVDVAVRDLAGEHSRYVIKFANDAAQTLSFEFESGKAAIPQGLIELNNTQIGSAYLAALTGAEVTDVASTTISVDAGIAPPTGGGIEVRWSDTGWGQANDRNLTGRFGTRTFTLPRLSRVQDYFLRQYDASVPPKYSRYSAALHVDYPYS
jgi:hypothetical protein